MAAALEEVVYSTCILFDLFMRMDFNVNKTEAFYDVHYILVFVRCFARLYVGYRGNKKPLLLLLRIFFYTSI